MRNPIPGGAMAVHDLGHGVRLWTREEWSAADPGDMLRNKKLLEAFVHHTTNANAKSIDSLAEQKAAMRATQNFHMDHNGWADIGYAFVVFQPHGGLENARVFQGRETRYVPAAQANHNAGTVPICVYGNYESEPVKPETVTAICRVIYWVQRHHRKSLVTVGGHRDVGQTQCPGGNLYAELDEIARRTGLRRF
jgi:hypothetical protein